VYFEICIFGTDFPYQRHFRLSSVKPHGTTICRIEPFSRSSWQPEETNKTKKGKVMSLGTILIILLVLALLGVLPTWGYSTSWGYAPGGIVGLLLVIVIILALLGRL
jgi:hypothetical protein